MNPRKLLALALVFVLALLSTGVLAYAQNADVESTPSVTVTSTESAPETPVAPVTTSAETQGPTQQPAATGTAAAETQGPTQQPAATGTAAAETQGPTQQPAATGTDAAETQGPTQQPAATGTAAAETQGPTQQPAATGTDAAETQDPTQLPAATDAAETQNPTQQPAATGTDAAETQGPTQLPTDVPAADSTETIPAETLPAETLPAEAQTLFDRLMACTTAEEARAILDNPEMSDAERAAMDAEISAMTEEQMYAIAAHLDALGYYDVETLDKSYTITQGESQNVSVSNIQTGKDDFSYSCSPSAGITVSTYNSYYSGGYTISVGKDVPVGTYTVTVNYKVREGWGPYSQIVSKTDTVNVKVTESDSNWKYSQTYYANPDYEHVAWDVVGAYSGGKPSKGMDNATAYVKSVKMANKDVTQADSDGTYPYPPNYRPNEPQYRVGLTLDNYFGTGKNSKSITLSIEPQPGYYITGYWIVCCNGKNAYNCAVMGDGNEYHASFSFSDSLGAAVSDTVKTEYFGHPDKRDDQYFIIVSVAPIPTPLFVDYNYGIIKDVVADSDKTIFTTPTSWTTTASGNVYGAGKVDTQNTQYRYTYNNASESANWKHYANSVTDEAKQAAWNAGCYFAGWHAEYYAAANEATATNDPDGKNYNYNMSSKYSAEADYVEGAEVRMLMHVKLTAKWNPIELKVTKQVSGLEGAFLTNHTYSIQVQKQNSNGGWDNYGSVREITVNGNGSASTTISGVTPGVYRAVEVESSRGDLTTGGKTMYVTVTDSGTVTYGSTPCATTTQELVVKNEYTSTPPYCDLTVKKTLSGNMYNENDTFEFTVKFGDTEEKFSLGNNGSKIISVPVGAVVTVTEVPGNYTYALSEVSPTTLAYTGVSNGISFTMPEENVTVVVNNSNNATITTGVLVDSLPYILILAVVVVIGVFVFIRRRRERDD